MITVRLICIGKLKTSWTREGCQEYSKRLQPMMNLEITELPASKQKDPQKQKEEECASLLKALEKMNGKIWVLDEQGTEFTSEKFSKELGTLRDSGEHLILILGGAFGLTDEIRNKADRRIALSRMTLPHELCRVVLFEQLYRAVQIDRGSGYHH